MKAIIHRYANTLLKKKTDLREYIFGDLEISSDESDGEFWGRRF